MVALARVDAVLAVPELYDVADAVAHRAVVLDAQVLEGVDEAALHVAALLSAYSRVDQTLAATHAVEEVLQRREPVAVAVVDEAPRLRRRVPVLEVGQCAVLVAPHDALATDRLLSYAAHHLADVEAAAPRAAPGHDDARVAHTEPLLDGFTRLVTGLGELIHDLDLEGLLHRLAWEALELAGLGLVYEVLDALLHPSS